MAHSTSSDLHALSCVGYRSISDAWSSASNPNGGLSSGDREHYVLVVLGSSPGPLPSSGHGVWFLRYEFSLPFRKCYCPRFRIERNWLETTARHSGGRWLGGSREISDPDDTIDLRELKLILSISAYLARQFLRFGRDLRCLPGETG